MILYYENRGAGIKFYRFFHSNASKFETSIPLDRMLKQWKLLRFTSQLTKRYIEIAFRLCRQFYVREMFNNRVAQCKSKTKKNIFIQTTN